MKLNQKSLLNHALPSEVAGSGERRSVRVNPGWIAFIRYCQELGYGEISQLKIQDGVPVLAEKTTKKVKFI